MLKRIKQFLIRDLRKTRTKALAEVKQTLGEANQMPATRPDVPSVGQPQFTPGFTPYRLVCKLCKKHNIRFKAQVFWSERFQRWQLDHVYDSSTPRCPDCGASEGFMQLDQDIEVQLAPSPLPVVTPSEAQFREWVNTLYPHEQKMVRQASDLRHNILVDYINKTYHSN